MLWANAAWNKPADSTKAVAENNCILAGFRGVLSRVDREIKKKKPTIVDFWWTQELSLPERTRS